jgi:hypothetical protein
LQWFGFSVQFFRLKDEVAANVDLARRRSRVAAFVALKSVSLRSAVRAATGFVVAPTKHVRAATSLVRLAT